MSPFDYPPLRERRHGPQSYLTYSRFLPWLRDEFDFRCVYCLNREQWIVQAGGFAIDHFLPTALYPHQSLEYANLLYACTACNLIKGMQVVPDPCNCLIDGTITVHEDGTIIASGVEANILIDSLQLNDAQYMKFRRIWIAIVRLARENDRALIREADEAAR